MLVSLLWTSVVNLLWLKSIFLVDCAWKGGIGQLCLSKYGCTHVNVKITGSFSLGTILHYAFLSFPGWRRCDKVYEQARSADPTQAYQILQQSLDEYGNKWVPVLLYIYLCVCVLVDKYLCVLFLCDNCCILHIFHCQALKAFSMLVAINIFLRIKKLPSLSYL